LGATRKTEQLLHETALGSPGNPAVLGLERPLDRKFCAPNLSDGFALVGAMRERRAWRPLHLNLLQASRTFAAMAVPFKLTACLD